MSVFSDAEIEYLASQRLGRLATVGHDGMPHVVPVAFRYNPDADTIDIGGHDFAKRKKFRDVKRTGMAALVVDDVLPPWQPRAVEVRGPDAQKSAETGFEARVVAAAVSILNVHLDHRRRRVLVPVVRVVIVLHGQQSVASLVTLIWPGRSYVAFEFQLTG